MPPWSPPHCRCPSSSLPSLSGTQGSQWFHCLGVTKSEVSYKYNRSILLTGPTMADLTKSFLRLRQNQHTICVHLIDHVLEFSLSRVLTKWPHDSAQLLSGDGPISIFIKQGEGLLELWTGMRRGGKDKKENIRNSWFNKTDIAGDNAWPSADNVCFFC